MKMKMKMERRKRENGTRWRPCWQVRSSSRLPMEGAGGARQFINVVGSQLTVTVAGEKVRSVSTFSFSFDMLSRRSFSLLLAALLLLSLDRVGRATHDVQEGGKK